jgi:hypothetical protein
VLSFPAMSDAALNNPIPQFATAEYSGMPGSEKCAFCNQPISQHYYRVNGAIACQGCANQSRDQVPPDSHSAYVRALIYGSGGAIAGLVLYAGFEIITGWVIGYLSLAVGYLIGKSMMLGSKGMGGRRYQIAAVLLTYAAVSMAAVPIGISQMAKQKQQTRVQNQEADNESEQPQQTRIVEHKMNWAKALTGLAILGLASPFLELQDPIHGLVGLVILIVGIRIAWKLTAGDSQAEVSGPFENTIITAS